MAKAVRTAGAPPRLPQRPQLSRTSASRQGVVEYFRGVWEELKKVVWPARDELLRMTGIVIATVILFGVLIGGADYVLSLGVRQLYSSSGSTNTTTTNPAINPSATAAPTVPPTAAPAPSGAAHPTPLP